MVLPALLLLFTNPAAPAGPAAAPESARVSETAVARARILRPLRIDRRGTALDPGPEEGPRIIQQRPRRDGAIVVDVY